MTTPGSHYFTDDPMVESRPESIDIALPDVSFSLVTDRGVFAAGRLDVGTRLLLLEAPTVPTTGTFLDLGCGAGPITVALALRSPLANVWSVDVTERARQLTARNAADNGCQNVSVAAPDEVPDDVRFDLIWSNPPIRIGKAALHALLERWLDRLSPSGEAVLVVQRHLGADSLAEWLRQRGHRVDRFRSRAGFRLLRVTAREQGTSLPGADV